MADLDLSGFDAAAAKPDKPAAAPTPAAPGLDLSGFDKHAPAAAAPAPQSTDTPASADDSGDIGETLTNVKDFVLDPTKYDDQPERDQQGKLTHKGLKQLEDKFSQDAVPFPLFASSGLANAGGRVASTAAAEAAQNYINNDDAKGALKQGAKAGGIAAALEAIPYVGSAAAGLVKRGASALSGVPTEAMDAYKANPEGANAAMPYAEDPASLKGAIDTDISQAGNKVSDAQAAAQAAKERLADAKASARAAKSPQDIAGGIVDHLDSAGEQLSTASGQAFDTLDKSGVTFQPQKLTQAVDDKLKSLEIGGVVPKIGPSAEAYRALQKLRSMINEIGGADETASAPTILDANGKPYPTEAPAPTKPIPAAQVKQIIQDIDGASRAAYQTNAGELSPEAAKNLSQVRGAFNGMLRDASEPYRKVMDKLSPQVGLVSDMSKVFGNEQNAMSMLNAMGNPIDNPRGLAARALLKQYDEANGTNFVKQVDQFFGAPRQAVTDAEAGLQQAQQNVAGKQSWQAPLQKLQPGNTEGLINSLQAGKNQDGRQALQFLDELNGTNHVANVDNAGVAKQFLPGAGGHSRARQIILNLLGGGAGATHGAAGVAGGIVTANAVDMLAGQYGPPAVKAALDAGIKVQNLVNTPFLAPIMAAAKRNPNALLVTHEILKQNPDYNKALSGGAQ